MYRSILDFTQKLMTSKVAVVDIETTDLKPEYGFIVEIGIVALTLEDGSCTPLFSSLIKEDGFDERSKGAWISETKLLKWKPLAPKQVSSSETKVEKTGNTNINLAIN